MLYYAISIFISAFLLFQIQPMISKYILPWFGGAPAVWSTSMLFFQVLLTGGYAYAYWLIGNLKNRKQGYLHIGLLGLSLATLVVTTFVWQSPITPDSGWRPESVDLPVFHVLKILTVAVGVPFFLLSTNSALMQAWFNRDYPNRNPYRLYVLSNIGSLLALISYPLLVEPNLTLQTQAYIWSLGYVIFALLASFGAIKTMKRKQVESLRDEAQSKEGLIAPSLLIKILWGLLPACASVLLLAVTNQITQEVSALPFLWVLPLALYLLSFILTFENERWYSRHWFLLALLIISGIYFWLILGQPDMNYMTELVIYSVLLFIVCMICHGELVKLRPHPQRLTSFYLIISIGGALGGIFVNLIAPYIFTAYFELLWGLFACWVLLATVTILFRQTAQHPQLYNFYVTVLTISIVVFGYSMSQYGNFYSRKSIYETRNYFGVLSVKETDKDDEEFYAYNLVDGNNYHGYQFINPKLHNEPTAYYSKESGIALAFSLHPNRPGPLKVGNIGLGVGTLAAYSQAGDLFRFYEINPVVVDLAEGEGGYFSYLEDALGEITVVIGDARLSLERELKMGDNQDFDILILDAYSSNSIPLHLITKEAFQIYLEHLKPNGILAVHISNKHLDLELIVATLAQEFDLAYAVIDHDGNDKESLSSTWAILSQNHAFFNNPHIGLRNTANDDIPEDFRIWTDDYSNLFSVLK